VSWLGNELRMSSTSASEDENTWRRRFASRANNRAWTLSEQASRTPAEDREMLDAAHAAMYLWSPFGTAANFAMARQLLGRVHALLGNTRYALPYAQAAYATLRPMPAIPCSSPLHMQSWPVPRTVRGIRHSMKLIIQPPSHSARSCQMQKTKQSWRQP
jgi:hypothetical protein